MFIPQSWVTEIVRDPESTINPDWSVTPDELGEGFVRVSFETEGRESLEKVEGPLVFGRVDHIEELEDFKKPIRFCQVSVSNANDTGGLQEVICGARNFKEGSTVIVAPPDYVLPGGFKISAHKTYGKISNGMLCSETELGMTNSSTDILTLPSAPAELDLCTKEFISLDKEKFEINITPDRGYALSARGPGREICSASNLDFADPARVKGLPIEGEILDVTINEDTDIRRFGLRCVTDINPNAEAPWWMRRRLLLAGQRPVDAATDAINYVILLLGQSMHAFGDSKIVGGLHTRNAKVDETLTTPDHVDRKLDPADIVICDDNDIQSLADIMGGLASETTDDTIDVILETANRPPLRVFRSDRRHKLSSEASRRFGRGVNTIPVEPALDLACQLLANITGGAIDTSHTLFDEVATMLTIDSAVNRTGEIAGADYPRGAVIGRLRETGCEAADSGDCLVVTPPTWRSDLTMSADLVEEILRLEGLEDTPVILPTAPADRDLTERQLRRRFVGHALAHNGYLEILPTPFTTDDVFDVWDLDADDPRRNTVKVINPLESGHAQLGATLLSSMLELLRRNVARGQIDLSLYGVKQVSIKRGNDVSPIPSTTDLPNEAERAELLGSLPEQPLHVATVACGRTRLDNPWGDEAAHTVADVIEATHIVTRATDVEPGIRNAEVLPWYPVRCVELLVGGHVIGHTGELHLKVCKGAGLSERACAMEINLDALPVTERLPAPVLSPSPAIHQDIMFVVNDETSTAEMEKTLIEGAGEPPESIRIFDVYRSRQMGGGIHSLACSLRFYAPDRTLKEEEASAARKAAIGLITTCHGVQLRG